jgi:hypothetical protein
MPPRRHVRYVRLLLRLISIHGHGRRLYNRHVAKLRRIHDLGGASLCLSARGSNQPDGDR